LGKKGEEAKGCKLTTKENTTEGHSLKVGVKEARGVHRKKKMSRDLNSKRKQEVA